MSDSDWIAGWQSYYNVIMYVMFGDLSQCRNCIVSICEDNMTKCLQIYIMCWIMIVCMNLNPLR